jgi:hypothetical protein
MKYKFDQFYENFFNKEVNPYNGSTNSQASSNQQGDNNNVEDESDEPTGDATENKIGDAFSQLAKNKGAGLNSTAMDNKDKQNVMVMKKGLEDAGYKGADLRRALMTALRVELDGLRTMN